MTKEEILKKLSAGPNVKQILKKLSVGPSFKSCNAVINEFSDFTDVIYYEKTFTIREGENAIYVDVSTGEIVKKVIDRSPLLKEDKNGVLVPNRDDLKISQILASGKKSCNRAKDNFYGYAFSNFWNYFLTFTIDSKYDKDDDKLVKKLYSKFIHKFTKRFKGVKVLCKPERTEKNQLHFHCLVGNCDLTKFLVRAINPHTLEPITSKCGHPVFNLDLWDFGFSQVAIIPKEDNQIQVVNYMTKYLTKDNNIGRFQKRFYHTRNLNFKKKSVTMLSKYQIDEIQNSLLCVKIKEKNGFLVLRCFKDDKTKEKNGVQQIID